MAASVTDDQMRRRRRPLFTVNIIIKRAKIYIQTIHYLIIKDNSEFLKLLNRKTSVPKKLTASCSAEILAPAVPEELLGT